MADARNQTLYYKRSRFSSRLPTDRLYTPSHYWLAEAEPGVWRVGFTKFATRMLGDLVEHGFSAKPGDAVAVGQTIGWVEGFKALTDLYCVADGVFVGPNAALEQDVTLTDTDPYGQGWLYAVRGKPEANSVDVHGYVQMLDLTIDKMQNKAGGAGDENETQALDEGNEGCAKTEGKSTDA
jgi:glycine cleavage system H protein